MRPQIFFVNLFFAYDRVKRKIYFFLLLTPLTKQNCNTSTSTCFCACASVCVVLCCVLHSCNSSVLVCLQHMQRTLQAKVCVRLRILLFALCNKYCIVNCIAQVVCSCALAHMRSASAACVVVCLCSIVHVKLHKRNSVLHICFCCVKLVIVCFCSAVVLRLLLRVSVKQVVKHVVYTLLFALLLYCL
jgi:hypothetical protein